MFSSAEAIRLIHQHRGDAVAITTMTGLRLWAAVSSRPEMDFPLVGCMGKASSVGLGVALAQPGRKVLVLDGDGSLLTNLGSLVTVAGAAPPNLYHFVLDDGAYTTTGGQPVPGAGAADLVGMARAAGYRAVYAFDDLEDFASQVADVLAQQGPVFASLKVYHEAIPPPKPRTTRDALREVRRALAAKG